MRRKISREGILETGQELFLARGYNGVSVGDITAKIGIPKGSFYNHFHSKHEFLAAVIDRYASESYGLVKKHLQAKDIPPLQRLKNYFAEASEYYSADPDRLEGCLMGNICQELGSVDPAIRMQLEANFRGSDNLLADLLDEAVRRKELEDTMDIPAMVLFITNSWQGALLRMKSAGNIQPLDAFQNVLFNYMLKATRRS